MTVHDILQKLKKLLQNYQNATAVSNIIYIHLKKQMYASCESFSIEKCIPCH